MRIHLRYRAAKPIWSSVRDLRIGSHPAVSPKQSQGRETLRAANGLQEETHGWEGDEEGRENANDGVGQCAVREGLGLLGCQGSRAEAVGGPGGGHAADDGVLEVEAVEEGLRNAARERTQINKARGAFGACHLWGVVGTLETCWIPGPEGASMGGAKGSVVMGRARWEEGA